MQLPGFELMSAEVSNGLETCIKRGLSRSLADFVPGRPRVEHFDGSISGFFGRLDLFSVFVAVADFQRQGIVANVPFYVNAEVDFHTVSFLKHHISVPAFNALNLVVGGEMGSQVVHRNGSWKSRFSTVPMYEPLSGLNDLVKGLSRLEFILHCLKGSPSNMPCISPILQIGFFHH